MPGGFANNWDTTYESQPADTDNLSGGAEAIRYLKTNVRQRMNVDHQWDPTTTDPTEQGEHRRITFYEPLSSNPSPGTDKAHLYTKDASGTAQLHFQDEGGNVTQLTGNGVSGWFDDGANFRVTVTNGLITAIADSSAGGHS
jgi:hypothetical protein